VLKIPELKETLPVGKRIARAWVKINAKGKAEWVRALESDCYSS
jgi:hypothetical protein